MTTSTASLSLTTAASTSAPSLAFAISLRRATGLLLIIVPLAFTVCFTLLQQLFEYPDILRQPTADILAKFAAGGAPLVAVWYVADPDRGGLHPAHRAGAPRPGRARRAHRAPAGSPPPSASSPACPRRSASCAGRSWCRTWRRRTSPRGASEAQRAAAGMVFEAFHRYAGMAVGEHLGYLSTSVWTLLVAVVMLRTARSSRAGWA